MLNTILLLSSWVLPGSMVEKYASSPCKGVSFTSMFAVVVPHRFYELTEGGVASDLLAAFK